MSGPQQEHDVLPEHTVIVLVIEKCFLNRKKALRKHFLCRWLRKPKHFQR